VFPLSYIGMVRPAPETARAVLLVLTRNALLVWLVADAGTRSWKALDTQRGSALERHPPGPESSGERSFR